MNEITTKHIPVLSQELIDSLSINPDGVYIDGTFGRGGHAQLILSKLSSEGRLICFDKDLNAIHWAKEKFADDNRINTFHCCFSEMEQVVKDLGLTSKVDGIILDLGVCSVQLDDASRGFSFTRSGPLDMRMNNQAGISAEQWLIKAKEEEISRVLKEYGQERFAKRIARGIKDSLKVKPITSTLDLVEIIKKSSPRIDRNKHPAQEY